MSWRDGGMDGGVEAWRERWRDGEMEGRMEKWKDGGMEGEMKGKLDGQTDACSGSLPTRVLAGRTSLCRPLSPRQPAQALLPTPGVQRGWSLQLQHPRVLHVPRESCCTQVPGGLHLPRPWLAAGPAAGGCPIAAPPPPPHFPSPPAQHPPSTPGLLPRFPTVPQNGGNWLGATFNPVPSAFPSHSPM